MLGKNPAGDADPCGCPWLILHLQTPQPCSGPTFFWSLIGRHGPEAPRDSRDSVVEAAAFSLAHRRRDAGIATVGSFAGSDGATL